MAILSRGQTFASGDQVTAQKLQDIVDLATFDDPADESTIVKDTGTGKLKVPSNGIGSNELASDASVDANRAVDTNHIKDGSVTAAKLNSAAVSVLMPTGTVLPYAGSTLPGNPDDYLFCNGAAVSRSIYSTLFAAIGTTYGGGNGLTSFNLPDLRGRVIAGQDDMGGTSANRLTNQSGGLNGDTLGATGGSETHLLTSAESGLPSHNHTIAMQQTNANFDSGSFNGLRTGSGKSTGTTGGTNASSAHNNVQPTIILNYIIKT